MALIYVCLCLALIGSPFARKAKAFLLLFTFTFFFLNHFSFLCFRQIESITEKLPRLTEADLERLGHKDASCSICLNTFLACLAEEEIAYAMDSPAQPVEDRGVTHLAETCGHVFCRKELSAICRCRIPQFQSLNPCANRAKISLLSWIRDRVNAEWCAPRIAYLLRPCRTPPVHSVARGFSSHRWIVRPLLRRGIAS